MTPTGALAEAPADAGALARASEPALERLAAFVGALRSARLVVPSDALGPYGEAVALVGASAGGLYWAGRTTLVSRRQDHDTYDRVFHEFWLDDHRDEPCPPSGAAGHGPPCTEAPEQPAAGEAQDGGDTTIVRASRREVLHTRDFAAYDPDELVAARALMAELRVRPNTRPSRRTRVTNRGRGRLDVRRTVAAARRTGGEVVVLHRSERTRSPRRIVFLLDISGSMVAYSRALLQFAQAATGAQARVEVFTIGTRLTRLTRELRGHDPDAALVRAAASVPDWSGGTRLGRSLQRFNDKWGVRGTARGAVVVILSDGWERDDPAVLADQLARLKRVAHRVIWVNPLKATVGYEPLARGMAAALPHVDAFVAGHNLESLEEVAAAMRVAGIGAVGNPGAIGDRS